MNKYLYEGQEIDSVELKCLLVSRGLKVDKEVYRSFAKTNRLDINPVACDCLILSDGTIVQLTDMGFHLKYLSGILSWSNLKLLRYATQLGTDFSLKMLDGDLALFYKEELLDKPSLPPKTDFYKRTTVSDLPFLGNAVLQGLDWVAFQCLWPCEYAAAGKPCEYCFSGDYFEVLARKGKPLPAAAQARDVAEIINSAVANDGCSHVQFTGGSTFDGIKEAEHLLGYLAALIDLPDFHLDGELLLYITPPADNGLIDEYFTRGADRIACSLEVADEALAEKITAGKMTFTTRERHIDALTYIAATYGPGKAFSNFIIGIEPFESLEKGARALAERGVLPTSSTWMPMGRPVQGNMTPPDLDYYRRVKELFAELYTGYGLEPPVTRGLNVCTERDIWNYACGL